MATTRDAGAVGTGSGLRHDIQALRALAVSAVIAYHLWPGVVPGGYVGVDVFFVVSGFLIAQHLLAELRGTGRIRLGRFWARRVKRLLPSATLVLLCTSAAVLVLVPLARWEQFLTEVAASGLFVQNWVLAAASVDYLASAESPSPVQHFWTLSVEEQFYLGLPLLLLLATRWVRGPHQARAVTGVLVGVTLLSFAWCLWQTATDPGVAYFSTLTRAWEFSAGALLAAVWGARRARLPARPLLAWLGVGLVVAGCALLGEETAFPGYAALLPVGGALLALTFGAGTSLAAVGRLGPVALVGKVSYAAYLWHWPLLVLLPYLTGAPLGVGGEVGVLVATLLAATASTYLVEDPVRFRPRLLGARSPLTVGATGLVAVALVLSVSGAGLGLERQRAETLVRAAEQVSSSTPCLGAAARAGGDERCSGAEPAGPVIPHPDVATSDDANEGPCWGSTDAGPKVCTLVDPVAPVRTVLAVGDSHNNTLIGVYRRLGEEQGWRVDVAGNAGCYLTAAEQEQLGPRQARGCRGWKEGMFARAASGGYDAVIVTHSAPDRPVVVDGVRAPAEAVVDGLVTAWNRLPDVPIVAIRDNPEMPEGILDCVRASGARAAEECAVPRAQALAAVDGQAEAARLVPRARVVDMTRFYCTDTLCPPVIGGVLVYRDTSHITATWAQTLAPYLIEEIVRALD